MLLTLWRNRTRPSIVFFSSLMHLSSDPGWRQPGQKRFLMAILTIVITDISMSLDNIIAIAALAHGQLLVLSIGLVVSIIILLIGSSLIALLLKRFPYLIYLSGVVLAWVSGNLILQDTSKLLPSVHQDMLHADIVIYVFTFSHADIVIYALTFSTVLAAILVRSIRAQRPPSTPVKDVDLENTLSNKH